MSALCHKRTSSHSLDHLVGTGEHSGRHSKVKRLSSFKIENCFVFVWRLHGKIRGLFSPEDAIHITGCLAILVDLIGSIGDQAPSSNKRTVKIDRGQLVPRSSGDDEVAMAKRP